MFSGQIAQCGRLDSAKIYRALDTSLSRNQALFSVNSPYAFTTWVIFLPTRS
jgi:hypothetical protein